METKIERIKRVKEEIKKQFKWVLPKPSAGMQCGMPMEITLECEVVDFKITIGNCRSQLKNKELAFTLFELYLDEIIK